jgi:hypothetical protein
LTIGTPLAAAALITEGIDVGSMPVSSMTFTPSASSVFPQVTHWVGDPAPLQ